MSQDVKDYTDEIFDDVELENKKEKVEKPQFNPSNYLDVKLKDGEQTREIKIRILPVSATNQHIAVPIRIHALTNVNKGLIKSGFKNYTCLNDEHLEHKDERGCPICNMAKELFKKANEETDPIVKKALCKEAYKYEPKVAYVVRVIDRSKEDEGVKFWRFNKYDNHNGIYDKLKTIYAQRNKESLDDGDGPYNVFDLHNGHDFIITLTKGENTNRTEVSIMDSSRQTPLSKDEKKIEEWVNDTKKWEDVYTVKPYDYLGIVANGGIPMYDKKQGCFVDKVEVEKDDEDATATTETQTQPVQPTTPPKPTAKPKPEVKVPETVTVSDTNDDDLPF